MTIKYFVENDFITVTPIESIEKQGMCMSSRLFNTEYEAISYCLTQLKPKREQLMLEYKFITNAITNLFQRYKELV